MIKKTCVESGLAAYIIKQHTRNTYLKIIICRVLWIQIAKFFLRKNNNKAQYQTAKYKNQSVKRHLYF